jgi:dihydropyrimidinase
LQQFVSAVATNPAKIFGLYPEKGTIAVGSDADLIIFDPQAEKTLTKEILHENVDYTPYEGAKLKGFPVATIARGEVIVEKGVFLGENRRGKLLKRKRANLI